MVLHARGEGVPCSLMSPLVIHRGLLATCSFVESRLLVSSFANVIGVVPLLQASEFYHVAPLHCCHRHLLYLVLISLLLPLLHGISPMSGHSS